MAAHRSASPEDRRASAEALGVSLGSALADEGALSRLSEIVPVTALEASVRGGGARGITGGRMMIERAPRAIAGDVARVVGVPWPEAAEALIAGASAALPLILGWDVSGEVPAAKVYLNASDASAGVRAEIARRLSLPVVAHVVGLNVARDGSIERKAYVQSPDPRASLGPLGGLLRDLAEASVAAKIAAGAVVSFDIEGREARPRAAFVALRDDAPDGGEAVLRLLPGYARSDVIACLPFEAGPPRSVGVSLGAGHWTAYFKLRTPHRTLYALEPVARFRAAACELGIFVEPASPGVRAYATTGRHAVSYRVLAGRPTSTSVRALMDWVTRVVAREERAGSPAIAGDPPAPWQRASA